MHTPVLALEIWELVIDQLSWDKHSLRSMGRVCKAFVPTTRRYLFHTVDFSLDGSDLDPEIFRVIAPYISEAKIADGCTNSVLSYELPRLKFIHFEYCWFHHESPLQVSPPILSSVTTLHLSNVEFDTPSLLFNIIDSFSNLSSLMLDQVEYTEAHQSSGGRPPPSRLSALDIRGSLWMKRDMSSAVMVWLKDSDVEIQKLAVELTSCALPALQALGSFLLTKGHTLECLTFDVGGTTLDEDRVMEQDGVRTNIPQCLFPGTADTKQWTLLSSVTFEGIVIGDSVHATSYMNGCLLPLLHHLLRAGSDTLTCILTLEIRIAGLYEVGTVWSEELDWADLGALLKNSAWQVKLVLSCDEEVDLDGEEAITRWRDATGSYLLHVLGGIDRISVEWQSWDD